MTLQRHDPGESLDRLRVLLMLLLFLVHGAILGAVVLFVTDIFLGRLAPVTAPSKMAASWENADVLTRTMNAAPPAIEARSRSGHGVRAIPPTA